ncbi:MAG TPA: hypothetical protein VFZ08_04300 [Terriglobia bacterium]|nr:hypothetical protein [Terriglobia bacterium]
MKGKLTMPEDEDMERAIADYEERQRQEKSAAKAALIALVDQLRALSINQVCATFNGYGDEGMIEGVEFLDARRELMTCVRAEQFANLQESFYPLLPAGYEQNEGSSGTVSLDVEHGRVVVDVNWNVTTIENQHYEV